jgi:hypothetical protein
MPQINPIDKVVTTTPIIAPNIKSPIYFVNYLNPTAACQAKANKRKNTGIIGIISTIGRKIRNDSGKTDNK